MAAYKCKIMTENGVILDRTLEAASVDEIRSRLKNQKEQLISAKKQGMSLDLGMLFSKFSNSTVSAMPINNPFLHSLNLINLVIFFKKNILIDHLGFSCKQNQE